MLYTDLVKNILKDTRIAKNINQSELAEMCSVSRQTIHSIEVNKYTPSVELALKISRALKVKVESLFILEEGSHE